jgi:hypothetical protein
LQELAGFEARHVFVFLSCIFLQAPLSYFFFLYFFYFFSLMQESCSGTPPLPRSYHTAAAFRAGMYVFGGTGATWSFFRISSVCKIKDKKNKKSVK